MHTAGGNGVAEKETFNMQPNKRTTSAGDRVGNTILLSISDKEYSLILPYLEFLDMPQHLTLYEPGQPLKFVYFPNTGMVSLVIATEDGRTVEVGEVGPGRICRGSGRSWHKQEPSARDRTDRGRRVQDENWRTSKHLAINSRTSTDSDPLCSGSGDAIRTNSRV